MNPISAMQGEDKVDYSLPPSVFGGRIWRPGSAQSILSSHQIGWKLTATCEKNNSLYFQNGKAIQWHILRTTWMMAYSSGLTLNLCVWELHPFDGVREMGTSPIHWLWCRLRHQFYMIYEFYYHIYFKFPNRHVLTYGETGAISVPCVVSLGCGLYTTLYSPCIFHIGNWVVGWLGG